MNTIDFIGATWRKSSRSGNASNCVEIANSGHAVGIRDSKNHAATLAFTRPGWDNLLSRLAR